MEVIEKALSKKIVKFIIVGCFNTIVGVSLMFVFYNCFKLGYWGSSFYSNLIASCFSFLLNKNYTFKKRGHTISSAFKFGLVILICYFTAYKVAEKVIIYCLSAIWGYLGKSIIDQIALLCGMCLFTVLNFMGQNFFAFRSTARKEMNI